MEAATIRAGISIGIKIAEYFGLIETVSTDVKKLVHQAFESANDNLEYAKTANGQNQVHYVLEAKNNFIKAVAVEDNENKVMALCGLAMCQFFLSDDNNARRTMNRIKDVELTRSEKVKAIAMDIQGHQSVINYVIYRKQKQQLNIESFIELRKSQLETLKTDSVSWIRQMLNEQ